MSKAFTKDDDAGEPPLVLPRRAPLPADTPNYVTSRGLLLLKTELRAQHQLRSGGALGSEAQHARENALQAGRIAELEARLASAILVDAALQPKDEVRFGASVSVRNARNVTGTERRYRIVGVDEADAKSGAIAFVSPLARSLLGKRIADVALLTTPVGDEELEILAISYD